VRRLRHRQLDLPTGRLRRRRDGLRGGLHLRRLGLHVVRKRHRGRRRGLRRSDFAGLTCASFGYPAGRWRAPVAPWTRRAATSAATACATRARPVTAAISAARPVRRSASPWAAAWRAPRLYLHHLGLRAVRGQLHRGAGHLRSRSGVELAAGLCNGADDDCDGEVDEACPCTVGRSRRVSTAQRATGAWDVHRRHPDVREQDLGSVRGRDLARARLVRQHRQRLRRVHRRRPVLLAAIDCGHEIGDAQPFQDMVVDGTAVYSGSDATLWEWSLTQGPCDVVLGYTSFTMNGSAATTIQGANLSQLTLNFQLSGSYTLTLRVHTASQGVLECSWSCTSSGPVCASNSAGTRPAPPTSTCTSQDRPDLRLVRHLRLRRRLLLLELQGLQP